MRPVDAIEEALFAAACTVVDFCSETCDGVGVEAAGHPRLVIGCSQPAVVDRDFAWSSRAESESDWSLG